MDYKFKESKAPIKKIESIQFGVLSPEYIKATSITQEQYISSGKLIQAGIFDPNTIYDQKTKKPVIGGVNDPRMGSLSEVDNPGYFGHIELASPVYHYCFIQTILNILKAVSFWSSKIIIQDKDLNYIIKNSKKRKRLTEIIKISQRIKICKDTKKTLPIFSRDSLKLLVEFPDLQIKRTLSPREVYEVFEKISDDDATKMGFNPKFCRPEYLLLKVIAVPPPHVRPTVYMSSSQKCEDDLTHKITDILKADIALRNAMDEKKEPHVIEQFENLLQYHVSTFFDNKIPGQKPAQQRSGKPLKTLRQRLVGKEGRVRGNLMGKRVDFSARSVITADPNLDMDQVGVPLDIAINLTVPEKVSTFNIKKLQNMVKNGPLKHPGAKYVFNNESKRKIDLNYSKEDILLKVGDIVERHLDNDDIVVFNRQPSLHKMSIMGHRVKVLKNKTFRLNLAVVSPYNADFDGDEMNMHVPQNQLAMSEIENLMMVPYMIVSPQSNKPVMGIIQDSLLSSFLMTSKDVFLDKEMIVNGCLEYLNEFDKIKEVLNEPALLISNKLWFRSKYNKSKDYKQKEKSYKQIWTGKQYFSSILDPRINLKRVANGAPDNDNEMSYTDTRVLISKGYLLRGRIDKKSIGTSEGSLIHTMFNDIGPYETMFFMNRLQKLANYWIVNNCFTIGITDTIINDYTKIKEILKNVKTRVNGIIEEKKNKKSNKLEQEINTELNSARDEAGNYVQGVLHYKNNFKSTVLSGSKGNNLNISQIIACLGQQNIEGSRVPYGFKNRTLPHYPTNDLGYESRGFIENSYISALTPQEFFFHAMAGREGIIDTACKSVVGDTDIIIENENGVQKIQIGKWIDELLENNKDKVQYFPEHERELLELTEPIYIPTTDNKGLFSHGLITAITRHNPTEYLYKITTESGRSVTVAESNSLLIWSEELQEFEPKNSPDVFVGDYVPLLEYDIMNQYSKPCIKDKIVNIEKIRAEIGQKVYDITVPSTYNFMIANGIVCRDTSLSGYTQRRIVKSLEDVMIKYDGTVRDSYDNIVQYRYGEDGIDATFIENQEFKTLTMSNEEMSRMFEHNEHNEQHSNQQSKILVEEFKQLLKDRDFLRIIAKHREPNFAKATDKMFPIPVNIQRILNIKKYIPVDDKDCVITCENIVNEVSKFLKELNATELFNIHVRHNLASKVIYGLTIKQFFIILEEIRLKYNNSLAHAGEMCGILAAQSISELTTQLTLNSFHSTGISTKNITLGLPRLTELINVSKKIKSPSLKLFIKEQKQDINNIDTNRPIRLEYKTLKDYISKSCIKTVEITDFLILEQIKIAKMLGFVLSSSYLKLDINVSLLESTNTTLIELYDKLITDKHVVEKCLYDLIKIFINTDNSKEPCIIIFQNIIDEIDDDEIIENLKNIEIEYVNKVHISGMQGITQTYIENKNFMIPNPITGEFEKVEYKCIETEGSCLENILKEQSYNFDHTMTTCNNILEIYQVLGIEATKKALFNELRMVLSFDGSYINYRHLGLLTDVMTYKGSLMSLTRHGINKNDTGTLVKCSFEETVEILTEAAMYSQKDQIKGVSENIMLGQLAPCGTGTFDVLFDENVVNNEFIPSSPKNKYF